MVCTIPEQKQRAWEYSNYGKAAIVVTLILWYQREYFNLNLLLYVHEILLYNYRNLTNFRL